MDVQLLLALILGIATIVVIVLFTRLDAFVALLIASLVTGAVAGTQLGDTLASMIGGFGSTLGSVGIVIGLGVAVGKILEVSGAADAVARSFLKVFGRGREPWAMGATGYVVSIPVFCDSGFIIMNPLARSVARRKGTGYVTLCLALGCGMTLTHHMLPPTPGPLGVAGILGTELGALVGVGMLFAAILLPVVVMYARWMGPKLEPLINDQIRAEVFGEPVAVGAEAGVGPTGTTTRGGAGSAGSGGTDADEVEIDPRAELRGPEGQDPGKIGTGLALLPLVLPLLLIVGNTFSAMIDQSQQGAIGGGEGYEPSTWAAVLAFLGHPVVALIIGLVIAVYFLLPRWTPNKKVHGWLSDAAASAGLIMLITGAGGGLGQVLRDSGVGSALADAIAGSGLPGFLVPFLVATLVRLAQGSGTVSMITAAGVTAPMVGDLGLSALVAALACCTGSMIFSYYNDSYFWVVTKFTGLDGTAALKGWSGITTSVWAASIPLLFVASLIL